MLAAASGPSYHISARGAGGKILRYGYFDRNVLSFDFHGTTSKDSAYWEG